MIIADVLVIVYVLFARNGIDSGKAYCTWMVTMSVGLLQFGDGVQTFPAGKVAYDVVTVIAEEEMPGYASPFT